MMANMTPDDVVRCGKGMKDMCAEGGDEITFVALFAGSHVCDPMMEELTQAVNDRLGTAYSCSCKAVAELDPEIREFIDGSFDVDLTVERSVELAQTMAKDVRSGIFMLVPSFDNILFGFVCTSRSSNNPHAFENVGCVQDGKAKTEKASKKPGKSSKCTDRNACTERM